MECYERICGQVNALERRIADLEDSATDGIGLFSFNVTSGNAVDDVSGGAATMGPATGQTLHLWSAGGLSLATVPGSAKVQVEPENLTSNVMAAGAPADPPVDASRPAIHLASDGFFYWAPETTTWVDMVSFVMSLASDDWGSQVVVSDSSLDGDGTLGNPLRVAGGVGGDDWGSQVVVSDATLTGNGTVGSPLSAVDTNTDLHLAPDTYLMDVSGKIAVPEQDKTNANTGALVCLDLAPSSDTFNGIRLNSDGGANYKYYTEDYGYRVARTFEDVAVLLAAGDDVLICSQLNQTANASWVSSTNSVRFAKDGSINNNGFDLDISVNIENPRNKQVFYGYTFSEAYPDRFFNSASIQGTFGGDYVRDARWWGYISHFDTVDVVAAPEAEADQNNDAIFAASQSFFNVATPGQGITVKLPAGMSAIKRPVLLSDSKCLLEGGSMNTTQLWAENNNYDFDTSHKIITKEYPTGSTPMVQIGWEWHKTTGINYDSGFNTGVRGLSLVGPLTTPAGGKVSGVMWHAGLQEGTILSHVNVRNFGGVAFGGPHQYQNELNGTLESPVYPQVNTVRFDNLWVFNPVDNDAVAMTLYGLNVHVDTCTFALNSLAMISPTLGGKAAVIRAGGRTALNFTNIHLEHCCATGYDAAGIWCDEIGGDADRVNFTSINYLPSSTYAVYGTGVKSATLWLSNDRGGYNCNSISNQGNYNFEGGMRCIIDDLTGNESEGYHNLVSNSSYVAHYARQMTALAAQTSSSDPAL